MARMYFGDGRSLVRGRYFLYRLELTHSSLARFWRFVVCAWRAAEREVGRGLRLRQAGRFLSGEDLPLAARLASMSTASFSSRSVWPGVQCRRRLIGRVLGLDVPREDRSRVSSLGLR